MTQVNATDDFTVKTTSGADVTVPGIESSLFGRIPAPRTVPELLVVIAHLTSGERSIAGWRGQSDLNWPIHSSAVRRVKQHGQPPSDLLPTPESKPLAPGPEIDAGHPAALEYFVLQYESYLLNQARSAGHDYHDGRKLSELELLATLQHYGAATRLLDFSRNVAVALWFACADAQEKHGLVLGIDAKKTKQLSSVEETTRSMHETVHLQQYPWTFAWQPRHAFERMRIQQSFFLFSKAEPREWGSLSLPENSEDSLVLVGVSPELKSEVARTQRERLFGFTGLTLFPDLEGFSRFHSAQMPYLNLG